MNARMHDADAVTEWWAVIDRRPNGQPFLYESPSRAGIKAKQWDEEYPYLAPHRVVRLVVARDEPGAQLP